MADMGSTNFFDVVTVGDDLSGLVASALLARRGLRVLLVDQLAPPDRTALVGCEVPRAPLAITGLDSAAWRRVIAELNLVQIFRRRVEAHRPPFQVVLPECRLDASTDVDAFARELERELPGEREGIEATLARAGEVSRVLEPLLGQEITLPPEGFWERRELGRYDARLPKAGDDLAAGLSPRARALVSLPALFSSSLTPTQPGPVPWARALDLWRRGVSRIDGGLGALRALLLERLRTHAGEVMHAEVESFVFKRSKVIGLKLVNKTDAIGANFVIAALPLARVMPLLPMAPPKALARAAAALRVTGHRRVLNLVIDRTGIPEGIASHLVSVRDLAAELAGANALSLSIEPSDDEGRVVVSAEAVMPAPAGEPAPADEVQAALLAHVRELMPFVDTHILGSALAEAPAPVYDSDLPRTLGVSALLHDPDLKHLFLASRENLPGLGLEGDLVSGWSVARTISQAAGKKDYLKDAVLQSG